MVGAAPVVAIALVVWIAESRSGAPVYDAVRVAFNGWLLAHGVPLQTEVGPVGLTPLALSLVLFWQVMRAGANTAKATAAATIGEGVSAAVAVGAVYGVIGAVVAFLAGMTGIHANLALAGGIVLVFGVVSAAVGVMRTNGIGALVMRRMPWQIRQALPMGTLAASLLVGCAALLVGVALALSAEDAIAVFEVYNPGVIGGIGLFGLSLVYAPTVALWGVSYVVGPGFAIGSGTSVSPLDVSLGPVPAFPLLAALPTTTASGPAMLLLGIPLAAGVVSGVALARLRPDGQRWRNTLIGAALVGPVAGIIIGVLSLAASGPLGANRLSAVGPSPWQVAVVTTVEIALFAVVGATVARLIGSLRQRPAELPLVDIPPVESDATDSVAEVAVEESSEPTPDNEEVSSDGEGSVAEALTEDAPAADEASPAEQTVPDEDESVDETPPADEITVEEQESSGDEEKSS